MDGKGLASYIIDRLKSGRFGYTKEGKQTIAPCGMRRRCKNNHRKCIDWDNCDRVETCNEKANMRLVAETMIRNWKCKPRRLRQILTWWSYEYSAISDRCLGCTADYCSVNGSAHTDCRQERAV